MHILISLAARRSRACREMLWDSVSSADVSFCLSTLNSQHSTTPSRLQPINSSRHSLYALLLCLRNLLCRCRSIFLVFRGVRFRLILSRVFSVRFRRFVAHDGERPVVGYLVNLNPLNRIRVGFVRALAVEASARRGLPCMARSRNHSNFRQATALLKSDSIWRT
jgi:hypothetical protein